MSIETVSCFLDALADFEALDYADFLTDSLGAEEIVSRDPDTRCLEELIEFLDCHDLVSDQREEIEKAIEILSFSPEDNFSEMKEILGSDYLQIAHQVKEIVNDLQNWPGRDKDEWVSEYKTLLREHQDSLQFLLTTLRELSIALKEVSRAA